MIGLIFLTVFAATYFGISFFRGWAEKKNFLDLPNDRSSHKTPTPRGGGVVIVALSLVSYLLIAYFYPASFSWGYLAGATLIAIVSWFDDLYSLWFVWRFLAHSISGAVVILDIGYWHGLDLPFAGNYIDLSLFGVVLTFLWITWVINAYNFMDGIDGIAGLQAVLAAFGWLVLCYQFNLQSTYYLAGTIAAASLAFLFHNWQPAKIFMGDVGSAFLGFTFASIPFLARNEAPTESSIFAFTAVLLLWFFLFDTVITFLHRISKGKNVFSAHREHIYQRLVISGLSHSKVTLVYGILTSILATSLLLSVAYTQQIGTVVLSVAILLTVALIVMHFMYRRNGLAE